MHSEIGARIKALREKKNFTQAEVGLELGVSDKSVSFWEKKGVRDKKLLQRLADYFGVSLEYLKEGITPESRNQLSERVEPYGKKGQMPAVVTIDSQGRDNVALVNVRARAGYLAGYADPEFVAELPAYRLPGVNNGTFRMFEVSGQSMYPTLKARDLVVCEWIETPEHMRDERIYVIVTHTEGIVIKRCVNRLAQYGFILAKSDNANKMEYPDLEIKEGDIQEIWYARWYMSTQFPAPSDLYNRMTNIEVEMHQLRNLLS